MLSFAFSAVAAAVIFFRLHLSFVAFTRSQCLLLLFIHFDLWLARLSSFHFHFRLQFTAYFHSLVHFHIVIAIIIAIEHHTLI
ncbi:hypothetical protein CPB84DRAFT_1790421 [Gymnopilus junonius]|uniref:Uncharacterized protein n=1 Tax=Gymnopilus junonius TaxID=109634 RepID=A0A9P5NG96_GYMJU|nr:hypothetical protein CPB84DRAFT_1790421 [Gymnopilus junonius]